MTKLALVADIHGNLPALRAIVDAVDRSVEHWICAGDIAGHLPMVDEVVDMLIKLDAHCVQGNHDRALLDDLPFPNSSASTRALQIQRRTISARAREWLAALPDRLDLEIDGLPVTVIHGGLSSYLHQRVTEIDSATRTLAEGRLLVLGHTHKPLVEVGSNHAIVNPGAVGLPADGDRRAHAVIFDTVTREVVRVSVDYDQDEVVARMASLGYDDRYRNCLRAGRWIGFADASPKMPILIAGASIYGEAVAELISLRADMSLVGFVDDRANTGINGVPIVGTIDQLSNVAYEMNVVDVAVAIGDNELRRKVTQRVWRSGVRPARLIHPSAVVSPSATVGPGCIVDAHGYIGPGCRLDEGVSIWPGAVLAHHVDVGAYSSIKHRVAVGGNSTIAEGSKLAFGSVWPSESRIVGE